MAKMLFTISKGIQDGMMVARAFHFAKVAKEKGHDVSIFLLEDGVFWAQFGISDDFSTTTRETMKAQLDYLSKNGTPIYVCKACVDKRLLDPEEFITGCELKAAPEYIDLLAEHDKTFMI
ncbi:MAG: DsrE family protein [Thermodesulfobacteriota bacterium]